jgi:predicted DNA repair protein MutK
MQIKYIPSSSARSPGLLRKTAALIATLVLAVVALMFSALLLAVILVIAIIGGIYLWWKLRKLMRNFQPPQGATMHSDDFAGETAKGEVIEGEVIRVDTARTEGRR